MTPQCKIVLDHLQARGSISPVEAAAVHRIRHLPRRIADLKDAGFKITTERRTDATGQRYGRYHLVSAPSPIVSRVMP